MTSPIKFFKDEAAKNNLTIDELIDPLTAKACSEIDRLILLGKNKFPHLRNYELGAFLNVDAQYVRTILDYDRTPVKYKKSGWS